MTDTPPAEASQADAAAPLAAGTEAMRRGDLATAIPLLAEAWRRDPADALAAARLGAALVGFGRPAEALAPLRAAAAARPEDGATPVNLAHALMLTGEAGAALAILDAAVPAPDGATSRMLPDGAASLMLRIRASALANLDRREAAAVVLEAAAPGDVPCAAARAELLAGLDRPEEAANVLRAALEAVPASLPLRIVAADLAAAQGRDGLAAMHLRHALETAPEDAGLWARLAQAVGRRGRGGRAEEAREAAARAVALTVATPSGPLRAQALCARAQVLGDPEEGPGTDPAATEAAWRAALEAQPDFPPALAGLGHHLLQMGRMEAALAAFETLKQRASVQGWSQLIRARRAPEDPAVLEGMERVARIPGLHGPVSTNLLFTVAEAWEKKGEAARAMALAQEANAASKPRLPYRPDAHRAKVERIIGRFSAAFVAARDGTFGLDTEVPVFVLGMPRSGTTLVEQMLAAHPAVHAAGELGQVPELIQRLEAWEAKLGTGRRWPDCVEDLSAAESRRFAEGMLAELRAAAPEAARITDKLPHNFENIGLILLLFPRARILHCRREPRDIALSNFFTDYAAKLGGMGFAYDLGWIGEQLVDHDRLLAHWHAVFPGRILEVRYEALVEAPEPWARRMLEFVGLDWDPAVLDHTGVDRPVKTASVAQVRQPIYRTSRDRWRRHAAALDPLEAALAAVPPPPAALPLPALPPGVFAEGMALLQSGQAAAAEARFRAVLAAQPGHAAARHFLGAALLRQGRPEEARAALRESLRRHRVHAAWFDNLATAERALGDTAAAARAAAAATRLRGGQAAAAA